MSNLYNTLEQIARLLPHSIDRSIDRSLDFFDSLDCLVWESVQTTFRFISGGFLPVLRR